MTTESVRSARRVRAAWRCALLAQLRLLVLSGPPPVSERGSDARRHTPPPITGALPFSNRASDARLHTPLPMPGNAALSNRALDARLQALRALRSAADPAEAREPLRVALRDRHNYVVSVAAGLAAELRREELLPDLLGAFDRFFVEPVRTDPSCLAKSAIARALRDLGHRGAEAFVRGILHVQLEPSWGGRGDSAANLRAVCALALPDTQLDDLSALTYLSDALADPEKQVRIDAASAIAALGRREGALPLRLKALLGDDDVEVLGHCFTALLSVDPEESV